MQVRFQRKLAWCLENVYMVLFQACIYFLRNGMLIKLPFWFGQLDAELGYILRWNSVAGLDFGVYFVFSSLRIFQIFENTLTQW